MNERKIPLSRDVKQKLLKNWFVYWTDALISSLIFGILFLLATLFTNNDGYVLFVGVTIILVIWVNSWLINGKDWKRKQDAIISQYKKDFK